MHKKDLLRLAIELLDLLPVQGKSTSDATFLNYLTYE
jgi:hypothetical protein